MASWSAHLALSGFHYSGVKKSMSFTSQPGNYFWSNGFAWGTCKVGNNRATITVLHGNLELSEFNFGGKTIKLDNFSVAENETKIVM
jgi:hypothetical protein